MSSNFVRPERFRSPALLAAAVFLSALFAASAANAQGLASVPLNGGDGGLECSCSNLGPDNLVLEFGIHNDSSFVSCFDIDVNNVESCSIGTTTTRRCVVSRSDGKPLKTKDVACSFSSLDAAGQPLVTVPVTFKVKF